MWPGWVAVNGSDARADRCLGGGRSYRHAMAAGERFGRAEPFTAKGPRHRTRALLACATMLVATLVSTGSSVGTGASAAVVGFPDVSPTSVFAGAINWMAQQGIAGGYPDGAYRPATAVSRQSMATFLYRFEQATTSGQPFLFTDVGPSHPFVEQITWMANSGITGGYADGGFRPEAPVTRGSMAAFLYRLAGQPSGPEPACTGAEFSDVPLSYVFCGEVAWLAASGVTTGFADGTFQPGQVVTRGSMAAFLHRLAGSPAAGSPGRNRADTSVVQILDGDEALSQVRGLSDATVTLAAGSTSAPGVGELVVMDATPAVPDGVVGRAVGVAAGPGGTIVVTVAPAPMQEIVPDFAFSTVVPAPGSAPIPGPASGGAPDGIGIGGPAGVGSGGWIPLNASCGSGGSIAGELEPNLDLALTADASWGPDVDEVLLVQVDATATLTATLTATAAASCMVELDLEAIIPTLHLPPVPLPGPLPPILPEISWSGALEAEVATSVTATASATLEVTAGAQYRNGEVTPIFDTDLTGAAGLDIDPPAATVHGFVGPRLSGKVGGILGAYVEVGPFVEAKVDPLADPVWKVDAGVEAGLGLVLDLWFIDEIDWELGRAEIYSMVLVAGGTPITPNGVRRVSADSDGGDANGLSAQLAPNSVSGDGRFVLFRSDATDLVGSSTSTCAAPLPPQNNGWGYYVRDLDAGTTRLIRDRDGTSCSLDVLAQLGSTLLVDDWWLTADELSVLHRYESYDLLTGQRRTLPGLPLAASSNGRFVLTWTRGSHELCPPPGYCFDDDVIHRWDATTGSSTVVGERSAWADPVGYFVAAHPAGGPLLGNVSDDGRYTTVGGNVAQYGHDAGVWDLQTGGVTKVVDGASDEIAFPIAVSADGRFVTVYRGYSVIQWDRTSGVPGIVSVDGAGNPVGSNPCGVGADGRDVCFIDGIGGIWVRDVAGGVTTRVDRTTSGGSPTVGAVAAELSADGATVVFTTDSSEFVVDDGNGSRDVFAVGI